MKRVLLIILVFAIASCSVERTPVTQITVTYSVTKENDLPVVRAYHMKANDNELLICLYRKLRVKDLKPLNFNYPYEVTYLKNKCYFYSAHLNEYMKGNEQLSFEIKY